MRVLRILDDALIDCVFQPAVNRLRVGNVAHAAMLCYALYAGAQVGRALVLHAHGVFGERAPYMAFDVATVGYTYALAILFSADAPSGPYPARHNPMFRAARLAGLVLTIWRFGIVPFTRSLDAEMLLSWGGYALWGAGLCFEGCASPPLRPGCRAALDAAPNAI